MAECQIFGFDCPTQDLCSRCKGTGEEPLTEGGGDPCSNCDRCFDDVIGWSTGIEPGTPAQQTARRSYAEVRRGDAGRG